jgi:AcrR family transcriptional regulator
MTSTRSSDTRQRLLDAAVTAFAERGFHGTTTRDIAAAAGMSPAAVYVHHKSKEELLYALARTGHDLTLEIVRNAIASAAEPREQLAATARAFALHHAHDHTSARVVNYELAALSPEHHAASCVARLRPRSGASSSVASPQASSLSSTRT